MWRLHTFVAQTVTIGEQKVCPESESLKFSTTPTPQVENPSDSTEPWYQQWCIYATTLKQKVNKRQQSQQNQVNLHRRMHLSNWQFCLMRASFPAQPQSQFGTYFVKNNDFLGTDRSNYNIGEWWYWKLLDIRMINEFFMGPFFGGSHPDYFFIAPSINFTDQLRLNAKYSQQTINTHSKHIYYQFASNCDIA